MEELPGTISPGISRCGLETQVSDNSREAHYAMPIGIQPRQ